MIVVAPERVQVMQIAQVRSVFDLAIVAFVAIELGRIGQMSGRVRVASGESARRAYI